MCVWECDEVLSSARKMMSVKCKHEPREDDDGPQSVAERQIQESPCFMCHFGSVLPTVLLSCLCDTRYEEVHGGIVALPCGVWRCWVDMKCDTGPLENFLLTETLHIWHKHSV